MRSLFISFISLSFQIMINHANAQTNQGISIDSLQKEVIVNGNVNAYEELFIRLGDWSDGDYMLKYDLIMAYEFGHIPAYENAFWCLYSDYEGGVDFSKMEGDIDKFLIRILKKGKKKGSKNCKEILRCIRKYNSPYEE